MNLRNFYLSNLKKIYFFSYARAFFPYWSANYSTNGKIKGLLRFYSRLFLGVLYKFLPNSRITNLKNKYTNKRCFILGNGPSLSHVDFGKLKNEITFAANGIFRDFERFEFTPTFYCLFDRYSTEDWETELRPLYNQDKFTVFACLQNSHAIPLFSNVVFLTPTATFSQKNKHLQFSYSPAKDVVIESGSYLTPALQLAFYMGFKEVYLLGVDHSYRANASNLTPGSEVLFSQDNSKTIDSLHYSASFYKQGDTFGIPDSILLEEALNEYGDIYERHNRKIYNATHKGYLEVFERVSFNDLFNS